jgi:dipeptidyl aminopeptidase/acylaminoacyl peptidase
MVIFRVFSTCETSIQPLLSSVTKRKLLRSVSISKGNIGGKDRYQLKKRLAIISISVLVVILIAYLSVGYIVYDRLTIVTPSDEKAAANSPTDFKITYPEYSSFDPAPYKMSAYQAVTFPSRQGNITLSGWYIEVDPSAPVVIVTHGVGGSKRDPNVLVPAGMLAHNGFNVLMYDMRNHGESDRDNGRTSIGNKEYQDVLGAWDWLIKSKGYSLERIGLYGVSLGGGTTLMAFGEEPRVEAAFVDSPFADLPQIISSELARNNYPEFITPSAILMARVVGGVDLLAHSPKEAIYHDNGRPLYIVHGTADLRISVDQTRELAALAQQNGANVTTWITEGVGHVGSVFVHPDEYEQRLIGFFKLALK